MQRFILSLVVAILPSIATAGGVCSPSVFVEAASVPSGVNGFAVVSGLINNDAIPDLAVVGNNQAEVSILLGQGAGAFDPPIVTTLFNEPYSITIGDFDGDTLLDLAIGEFGQVLILLGHGDGTFDSPVVYATGGGYISTIIAATLDANASLDLALADTYYSRVDILLNDGNGAFGAPNSIPIGSLEDLVLGDFGGDGVLDLATANGTGTVSVLTGIGNGGFGPPKRFHRRSESLRHRYGLL